VELRRRVSVQSDNPLTDVASCATSGGPRNRETLPPAFMSNSPLRGRYRAAELLANSVYDLSDVAT
jgi:hypothetical protein